MAEETSSNLEGKRVSTTFRGLLHFPKSIDTTLSKQIVYDGVGTATALTLGGDTKGMDVSGPLTCTGGLSTGGNFAANGNTTIQGNAAIQGNATIQGDITLVNGGKINDIDIYSSASAVSLRAPNTSEVGKLRIRETTSDYEMLFGNPTVTEKNLFSIIVKNDTSNNLYIKNNYNDFDFNAPLWINRATGEVNIRTLRVSNIKTVLPPGISTPPNQESTYGSSNRNVLPVGMIVMFPVFGIPDGWLPCDGREHNKQTLPELFNVIGYNYSVAKSGDSFQVPDYRGLFIRGADYTRNDEGSHTFIDPDGERSLDGSIQVDEFKLHTHPSTTSGIIGPGSGQVEGYSGGAPGGDNYAVTNISISNAGGAETRPKNVVALYCIKW